jgi:hypothetical protein
MSDLVFRAQPLSKAAIGGVADQVRGFLGLADVRYFPVPEVLELLLPKVLDNYVFRVAELEELGDMHGMTKPDEREITLRTDVYDRMLGGAGRDRLTGCHEIGHLVLHPTTSMARRIGDSPIKTYEDPEWQANCFAGSLLMPQRFFREAGSVAVAVEMFGVTAEAARTRMRQLKLDWEDVK